MKFGLRYCNTGRYVDPAKAVELVQAGEEAGFESAWTVEHTVVPEGYQSAYPYSDDGKMAGGKDDVPLPDPLIWMAYAAAATKRIKLATGIMILPQHSPVVAAKQIATLDYMSGGRVLLGIGVGWMREEFEALNAPDFDKRGASSNEFLEIFKKAWTEDPISFDGEFYSFPEVRCMPQPVQDPHPPIWIGGHSKPARRRVAKYGDGWHPVGSIAASPLPPEKLQADFDDIKRMAEAEGRDPEAITICYKAPVYDAGVPVDGADRKPFTGSFEQIADDVRTFEAIGVSELVFDFRSPTFDQSIEMMNAFGGGVMPLTK